jgi:chemotaxis protein CheY-P-specific phosphatase CheC
MLEISQTALGQALSDALETMAFIAPSPPEDASPSPGPAVLSRIEYRGAANGALELACPEAFGAMLVANLLGCPADGPDANERAADALRELINITCGTILRSSDAIALGVIEMGVPTQAPFDLADWDAFIGARALLVDADGHKLALRLVAFH